MALSTPITTSGVEVSDSSSVPKSPKFHKPGAFKGKLTIPEDFLTSDPELEALFLDSPIMNNP